MSSHQGPSNPAGGRVIFDVGMSDGDDTDFYLKKGFSVLGVEADPVMVQRLQIRFSEAIRTGRLNILNRAVDQNSDAVVEFFCNSRAQGHSRICVDRKEFAHLEGEFFSVSTINYRELLDQSFGGVVPYYLKVDVEGAEVPFINSMRGLALPPYISTECHSVNPVDALRDIGYEKFRIINQTILNSFVEPNPPLEGVYSGGYVWRHSSGMFGRELPGKKWYNYSDVLEVLKLIQSIRQHETLMVGWFDCHAFNPDFL